jgi:hypothetical protein
MVHPSFLNNYILYRDNKAVRSKSQDAATFGGEGGHRGMGLLVKTEERG